jgi:sec-independent protein translocase protein TatC
VLGVVFETPLVVMGLAKLRVVTADQLLRRWRFAMVGSFLVSAIVTPTIDPVTQTLVAGPMIILYFVGTGLAWLVRR